MNVGFVGLGEEDSGAVSGAVLKLLEKLGRD
jgi:hypothetical protein